MEYKANLSKYVLKIPSNYFLSIKPRVINLMEYLNTYCEIDYSSYMRVKLTINDRILRTIQKIQNMDIFRYIISIDSEYINNLLTKKFESPYNLDVKCLTPYEGVVINSSTSNLPSLFDIPSRKYYNIDFSEQIYGSLYFNYIGGDGWSNNTEIGRAHV